MMKNETSIASRQRRTHTPARLSSFQWMMVIVAIVVTGAISFLAGILYDRQTAVAYSNEFEVFWEGWDRIDEYYYGNAPSERERVYGALNGLVTSLEDPYSGFAPPVQAEINQQALSGVFGGIGAFIGINEDNEFYIERTIFGNPAQEAGVEGGDIIRAVDGESVEGLDQNQLVELVKGEIGSEVTLTLYRPTENRSFDVTITRAAIEEPVVYSRMIEDIGYLNLTSFKAVAEGQMQSQLHELLDQDPRAIIFDLRGNGGGLLEQAEIVADLFLDEGLIVIQRSRQEEDQRTYADGGDEGEDIPLVVLIDGGSASASEVVSGALQDRDRAVLIGQPSFGKGIVQSIFDLSDGSQLKLTTSAWYTPDDRAIHGEGLEPDILIEGDQYADGIDRPLQAAIDHINENVEPTQG